MPELTSLGRGSENGRREGVGGGCSIHRKQDWGQVLPQAWGERRGGWGRSCSNPAHRGCSSDLGSCVLKEFTFLGIHRGKKEMVFHPRRGCGAGTHTKRMGAGPGGSGEAWGRACPAPRGKPPTSLEGTAQPRLAVPLVITDGPIAAFGGRFSAVTPDAQLISTALTVPGAELQGGEETQQPASSDLGEPSLSPPPAWNA